MTQKKSKQYHLNDHLKIKKDIQETANLTWLTTRQVENLLKSYCQSEIKKWEWINWEFIIKDFGFYLKKPKEIII
jgi:hypothetical protein